MASQHVAAKSPTDLIFVPNEFEPENLLDNSTRYEIQNRRVSLQSKCTGRGTSKGRPPSILKLNLPPVVVQSMKKDCRSRGRGRAKLPKFNLNSTIVNTVSSSIGHGKPLNESSAGVRETKPCFTNAKPSVESSPSLQENLSTASKRFQSYGQLIHNPASTKHIPRATLNVESRDQFPSLPTLNFSQFSKTQDNSINSLETTINSADITINSAESSTKNQGTTPHVHNHSDGEPSITQENTLNSLVSSTPATTHTSEESQSLTGAPSTDRHSLDNTAAQIDALFRDMNNTNDADNPPIDFNILAQSTPAEKSHKGGGGLFSKTEDPGIDEEERHYMVRVEHLPISTTQSQLEEVISPYGQVLDIKFELRITNGVEILSADVRLADGSTAEFLASCLDGAETIFEGTHSPVKCYIK